MEPQWALILGASEGTGAAVAKAVARNPGWHVFGVHRGHHSAEAAAVADAVRACGRRVFLREAEAGTADSARLGVEQVREIIGDGRIGLFVHSIANASVGSLVSGDDAQLSERQIEKTFSSMAHSFVYWTRELLTRELFAPGASLVGLTNPIPDSLVPGLGLTAATKATLEVYVRQLAVELGPQGYRVNLVNFGLVDTPAARVAFGKQRWQQVKDNGSRVTPARRLCTVEEVARFVCLLASSDDAAWFNGANIDFTGGMIQSLLGAVLTQE